MSLRLAVSRVIVTGGAGFLGRVVVERLRQRGCTHILVPRRVEYDLTRQEAVERLFREFPCDVVIHLAARVGGIGANRRHPGLFLYENLIMGLEVMEQARKLGVKKFVTLGTVCAYPRDAPVPFREEDLWEGYPEETNAAYGLAKKMLLVQAQAYRQEYAFNGIHLLPVNLYGPGDNFDPETSHVIPALIRKCFEAKRDGRESITAWGTGEPTREFLYVEDAAEGILLAAERYDDPEPINLGSGREIRISELARLIAAEIGYKGDIIWDRSQPDGQPRRCLEVSRAAERFGFRAKVSLEEGLRETIRWYLENGRGIEARIA